MPRPVLLIFAAAALAASTALAYEYRLVGPTLASSGVSSTTYWGRLEVRASASSSWGNVCDDAFGSADAQVACRSLGLTSTVSSYRTAISSERGSPTQATIFDDLACSGTESELSRCSRSASENCAYTEAIVVGCGVSSVPSFIPAASQSRWSYRLSGGGANYGRLEVSQTGGTSWSTVCDDSFSALDATVACRSLGLSTATVSYRTAASTAEQGSGTIGMDNLACSSAEYQLDHCVYVSAHNCGHNEDVWVGCGLTSVPSGSATPATPASAITGWQYRLVGGTSATSGRLEARRSTTATWGTICDDFFGASDARVACRSLGLSADGASYSTVTSAQRGLVTQPTVMDNLACQGTEASLDVCSQASSEDCSASEAIYLICQPSDAAATTAAPSSTSSAGYGYRLIGTSTYGRLEVQRTSTSAWGTVCDDSFGLTDARVACRSLGLSTTTVGYRTVTSSERGSTSQPTLMDDLACSGTEASLDVCRQSSSENCWAGEAIAVACGLSSVPSFSVPAATTTAAPTTTTAAPTVTSSSSWQYRLIGGTSTFGRLEARPDSATEWGTICDDGFGATDARVACRSLGLTSSSVGYRTVTSSDRVTASTSQPIAMDDLACSGTESSLDMCSRASRHNCAHSEDIALSCGSAAVPTISTETPSTPTSPWQYRLVGGSRTHGRLEVRPSATASWGTVCDDLFGASDARVACRSLGLPTTTVGYRRPTYSLEQGTSSQAIRMDNLACTGTEAALSFCSRASSHNCGHSEDIILSCGSSSVGSATGSYVTSPVLAGGVTAESAWVYRLSGGTSSTWGRLEVRQAESVTWGVVCASGFGLNDAVVACRSLGFTSSLAAFRTTATSEQAPASTPALMAQLACTGTEATLHQCGSGTGTCSATSAVVLACGTTTVPGVVSTSNSNWEYRLAGGTSSSGRLEVRPVGVSAFGTVCDDSFGATDARVACRSLGFSSYSTYRTVTTAQRGATSQAILMDDVACSGSESELRYCRYTASHNCAHSEDVYLSCTGIAGSSVPAVTTASPASLIAWRYRLAGGAASNTGRLEVLGPTGSSASSYNVWGSVCDDSFSRVDAIVACRSLGLSSSPVSYRTAQSSLRGASSQPILMDDLACSGSESRLDECSRSARHNCAHTEDVELTCGSLAVPVRSTVRIGGNGWRSILASESSPRIAALHIAVQEDVAQLLGVESTSVSLTRLSLGSLIVEFEVNATSNDAAVALANTINASTGRTFTRAQAIYAADTTEGRSGETTTISDAAAVPELAEDDGQVSADSPSAKSTGDSDSSCGTTCVVGVLIAVGIIVAVVCAIGFFLFRSNPRPPQDQQQQQQQQEGQNPIVAAQTVGGAPPAQGRPQYPYPPQQNDGQQAPIGAVGGGGGVYDNQPSSAPPQQQPHYPYPPQQPPAANGSYPPQQQQQQQQPGYGTYAYPPQPTPMTSTYGQQPGPYPQPSPYAPPQQYGYPAQPAPGQQPAYGYPVQQPPPQQQSMNASQNACTADVPMYPDQPSAGPANQQNPNPMPGQPDDTRV